MNFQVKIISIDIWETSLEKYLNLIKISVQATPPKQFDLKLIKSIIKNVGKVEEEKEESKIEENVDLSRLSDCFKYICDHLYKTSNLQAILRINLFTQRLLNSIKHPQIHFQLLNLWAITIIMAQNIAGQD